MTPSLVVSLRRGDENAAELLERLYRARLVRFCAGYLGSSEAEDAVQEVFVRVLETETVPDRFGPWLLRAARNLCLNRLRDRPGEDSLPSAFDLAQSLSGEPTRAARREDVAALAKRLTSLPFEQSEALRLRYLENLSRDEIAEIQDVPPSTVKSRLFEGTKRLRETTEPGSIYRRPEPGSD